MALQLLRVSNAPVDIPREPMAAIQVRQMSQHGAVRAAHLGSLAGARSIGGKTRGKTRKTRSTCGWGRNAAKEFLVEIGGTTKAFTKTEGAINVKRAHDAEWKKRAQDRRAV